MRYVIKVTRLTLTDALATFIGDKLSALQKHALSFEEHGEMLIEAEVGRTTRHHRKGEVYYVELTAQIQKKTIRIEQYDENLRAGVTTAQRRFKLALEELKKEMNEKTKKVSVARTR